MMTEWQLFRKNFLLGFCFDGPIALLLLLLTTYAVAAQDVPGVPNPDVDQTNIKQTICQRGWTRTVRPAEAYTEELKQKLLPAGHHASEYELDHLIPLEVGGNPTSDDNLWLQPWHGHCNAKQKDLLENKVNRLVCAGRLTLKQGQEVFSDWKLGYSKYINQRGC